MMEENRMRLSGIAAPKNDEVRFFDLAVRRRPTACSENRRQTGDAWGVSSPVTTVDVVAANRGTHEFLRGEIHFIGCLRAAEHAERGWTMSLDNAANTLGRRVQRLFPRCRTQLPVFTNEGFR
jgi:hypothetical protein